MNVLLLKPCWPYPISPEESTYNRIWPPLSLAYTATLLEEAGIRVQILDAHAERLTGAALVPHLPGFDKIFVTSSDLDRWLCPNLNLTPVVEAVRLASAACPDVSLMGQHGTVNPEGMLRMMPTLTAVIRGEPEFTVRELCLASHRKQVTGISYRDNGTIAATPPRPLARLDELPQPAWHRLPLSRYRYELLGDRFMLMEMARGCPFRCTFCAKEVMYGPGLRRRSLERVLAELDEAVGRHGIRSVYFYDLEFLVNRRYVESLCEALIARRAPIRWCVQTRVTDVDQPILRLMRRAGCRLIHFGIESGSQRVLDDVQKEATVADAERAIALTKRAGIETLGFFMLGLEGETPEELEQTIRLAQRLRPTYASFHVTSPHRAIAPVQTASDRVLALPAGDQSFSPRLRRRIRQALAAFYLHPAFLTNRLRRLLQGDWELLHRQLRLLGTYLSSLQ